jgi:hypothetical protein
VAANERKHGADQLEPSHSLHDTLSHAGGRGLA